MCGGGEGVALWAHAEAPVIPVVPASLVCLILSGFRFEYLAHVYCQLLPDCAALSLMTFPMPGVWLFKIEKSMRFR